MVCVAVAERGARSCRCEERSDESIVRAAGRGEVVWSEGVTPAKHCLLLKRQCEALRMTTPKM